LTTRAKKGTVQVAYLLTANDMACPEARNKRPNTASVLITAGDITTIGGW